MSRPAPAVAAAGDATVGDRVRSILAHQLGLERGEMEPEANLLDDLGADSLDVAELVMRIEEVFGIEVPDCDLEKMRTVADVEHYVQGAIAV